MKDQRRNRYYTRKDVVSDFFKLPGIPRELAYSYVVFEPCNGQGHISQNLPFYPEGVELHTNDVDENAIADTYCDIMKINPLEYQEEYIQGQLDLIITNPPFQTYIPVVDSEGQPVLNKKTGKPKMQREYHASDFIRQFMHFDTKAVVCLLRSTFQEACRNRRDLLLSGYNGFYLTMIVDTPRISFTGDSNTDNATTCWFVWLKDEKYKGQRPQWDSLIRYQGD